MDKAIVSIIAAVGALAPAAVAEAAVTPDEVSQAMNPRSFSELLGSIPNASAILRAVDEHRSSASKDDAATKEDGVQLAWHDHHHHHHHHWWYHHHHHHHHHHWYYHHHHHHHHYYY